MKNVNSMLEVTQYLTETEDKFILDTITPYCRNITRAELSKKDIKEALNLLQAHKNGEFFIVNKYPNKKPTEYEKTYAIWIKDCEDFYIAKYNVTDDVWWLSGFDPLEEGEVTHWAELPSF